MPVGGMVWVKKQKMPAWRNYYVRRKNAQRRIMVKVSIADHKHISKCIGWSSCWLNAQTGHKHLLKFSRSLGRL